MDADQRHRPDLVFSESETGNAPGTACHAKSSVRRGYPNGVVHTSPRATPWGRRDNPSSPVRASHQRGLQGLMSRPFRAYTVMPMGPRASALGWYVPPFQGFQDPASPLKEIPAPTGGNQKPSQESAEPQDLRGFRNLGGL